MTEQNKGHAILIVDDEPNVIKALQRSLRNEAYVIHTAQDVMTALQLIDTMNFSVIISDYTMPNMSGAELLSRVKSKNPRCVRIMLSGATNSQSVPQPIATTILNCDAFVSKPWDDEKLRIMVREAITTYEKSGASASHGLIQACFVSRTIGSASLNPETRNLRNLRSMFTLFQSEAAALFRATSPAPIFL